MEDQQYILIESTFTVNNKKHTAYGIALAVVSDESTVMIESIPDLSQDKERIQNLAKLCTELHLSPIHLTDVVADFLAE
jgi:hypothetical protein